MSVHAVRVIVCALAVALGPATTAGQEAPRTTLKYRRIYVPQDEIDQQVRGLLPLRRDEFEERLSKTRLARGPGTIATQARIERARYRARLEQDCLVEGTAELDIHVSDEPLAFPLEPCNLALANVRWRTSQEPVVLGQNQQGALVCMVKESDQLRFDWSLRGNPLPNTGELSFALQIPSSSLNELELELPADKVLRCDAGLVQPAKSPDPLSKRRQWIVQLAAAKDIQLQVLSGEEKPDDEPTAVREDCTYTIRDGSIDIDARLAVEQGISGRSVMIEAEPECQIISVRSEGRSLDWTIRIEDGTPRTIEIASPTGGESPFTIQINAIADWDQKSRAYRLPRLKIVGAMQQGQATIRAAPYLALQARPMGNCQQTAFSPAGSSEMEQFQFQLHSVGAGIEVHAPQESPALTELSGTHLELQGSRLVATTFAELKAVEGRIFGLDALVPRRFVIDSVDVQPPEMLESQTIEARRQGPQRVAIMLRRPLEGERSLRLTIKASADAPFEQNPLPTDLLRVATFPLATQSRRLLSLGNSDSSREFRLGSSPAVRRLDAGKLNPDEAGLFERPPRLILELDRQTPGAEVTIARASPQFIADIAIRAEVMEKETRQSTKVKIRPQTSALGSATIRFAPSPATTVQFRWNSPTGDLLPAVRRDASGSEPRGDTYLITLPELTSQPFEIHADFVQPRQGDQVLALAAVEGAASQTGLISVHSKASTLPMVSATDVTWLPPVVTENSSPGYFTQALQYDPAGLAQVVIKQKSFPADQHLLWAESLQVSSRISVDGSGAHEAVIRLRNAGQEAFSFRLPYQARGMRVIVDGQDRVIVTHAGFGTYLVQLPENQPLVTARIHYSSSGPGAYSWLPRLHVSVPVPETSTPVLTSQWRVQLPSGLALVDADKAAFAARQPGELLPEQPFLEMSLPKGPSASLTLYRFFVSETWCVCAGALGLVAAYRFLGAAFGPTLFVSGILAAAAIVAPQDIALLSVSVSGGLLAGVIARSLVSRTELAATPRIGLLPQTTAVISAAQSCIVAAMVCLAADGSAIGQDQRSTKLDYARVIVPIENERQPVGDYVYLEPALYDALIRSSDRDSHSDQYLLTSATYSIPEPPRRANDAASFGEISIRLEFETFRPDVAVQLPLRRSQLHLIERRALLDGRPLALDWSAEGDWLSLTAQRAGKHRLELVVGALAQKTDAGASLKFSIPRINASRVQILAECPETTTIRSAAGAARRRDNAGKEFDLGPAGEIDLLWPLEPGQEARMDEPTVTQLILWRMQPNSVVADARFHIRSAAGKLGDLTITADHRLRLLPRPAAVATHRVVSDENTGSTRIEFVPGTTEATVELSWAWEGATGLGAMNVPKLHLASGQVQSWTAIALNPDLELESPLQTSEVALREFLSRWGVAPEGELLALDRDQPIPMISLRPKSSGVRADERLTYSVSQRHVKAEFDVALNGLPRLTFQHRLQIDSRLRPLDVRVLENGEAVGARWAVHEQKDLVIQLVRPAAPAQQIQVVAEFAPDRAQSKLELPLIHYLAGTKPGLTVRVYRQQDVNLQMDPPDVWQPVASAAIGQHQEGLGRLVGEWTHGDKNAAPPLDIVISANRPRVSGQMLTLLKQEGDKWKAEVKCDLQVKGGALDAVRLQVPSHWKGPFTVLPAAETKMIPLPGERYQILELTPQLPLAGQTRLELSGPCNSNPGENLAAPEVALLDLPQVNHLVALPRQSSGSRMQWETGGLQATNSKEVELLEDVAAADYEIFKAASAGFTAVSRIQERAAIRPQVHLAHYNVRILDDDRMVALAELDITAPEDRRVLLDVPLGWQLLHARVEGVPCPIARISSRRWVLTFPAGELPLRLEAFYSTGSRTVSGGTVAVEGLILVDLPNARTVWSVEVPANLAIEPLGPPERAVSSGLERLESLAAVLKQVASIHSSRFDTAVLANSYQIWESRFEQARIQVSRLELSRDEQRRMLRSIATANEARQEARALGLSVSDTANVLSPLDEAPPAIGAGRLWHLAGRQGDLTRPRIALSYDTAGSKPNWPRWPIALLAASFVLAAITKNSRLQSWVVEHCRLLLALVGVIWLAVGPAPWLGWLLIFAAVLSSLLSPWRRFSGGSRLQRSTIAGG